jgi:hypothetical protein
VVAADYAGLTDEKYAMQRVIDMREKRIHLGSAALNQALLEEEQARMEKERQGHLAAAGAPPPDRLHPERRNGPCAADTRANTRPPRCPPKNRTFSAVDGLARTPTLEPREATRVSTTS